MPNFVLETVPEMMIYLNENTQVCTNVLSYHARAYAFTDTRMHVCIQPNKYKKNILVLLTVFIYSEIFSLNAHESSTPHCFVESIFTIYNLKTVLK